MLAASFWEVLFHIFQVLCLCSFVVLCLLLAISFLFRFLNKIHSLKRVCPVCGRRVKIKNDKLAMHNDGFVTCYGSKTPIRLRL